MSVPSQPSFFFLLSADSLSIANDIERVFSRPGGGNSSFRRQFEHHKLQSAPQHEQKSSKGMRSILLRFKVLLFFFFYNFHLTTSQHPHNRSSTYEIIISVISVIFIHFLSFLCIYLFYICIYIFTINFTRNR